MRRTGLEVGVDGTSDTDRGQRGVYVLASNVCSRVFRTGDGVVRTRIQALCWRTTRAAAVSAKARPLWCRIVL